MNTEVKTALLELDREVKLLRSFVIGVSGKDEEGEYHPEFVRRILAALSEKPAYQFKDKKNFLAQLRNR